jgi:phosphoesterase RecJ-like protein
MLESTSARQFRDNLLPAIAKATSICLTTHINPDGDGLCACLAVKRILQNLGYKADIVVDDLQLDRYEFMQVYDNVILYSPEQKYDLVIVIDLHDTQRLGDRHHLVQKAQAVCVLDHHEIENDMMDCAFAWVQSSAVCTGWMVFELFKAEISTLSAEDKVYVGTCLYTTLLNDTNNFTNANTDSHAFALAQACCDYGVKTFQIYRKYMISRSPVEMRLIGQVLSTIKYYEQDSILFMHSTLAMLNENNLDTDATSNMTRWVQDLKGVQTICYFREEETNQYRLSLRSKAINVHSIAIKYGGGGHIQASGCNCKGTLAEVEALILAEIAKAEKLAH